MSDLVVPTADTSTITVTVIDSDLNSGYLFYCLVQPRSF